MFDRDNAYWQAIHPRLQKEMTENLMRARSRWRPIAQPKKEEFAVLFAQNSPEQASKQGNEPLEEQTEEQECPRCGHRISDDQFGWLRSGYNDQTHRTEIAPCPVCSPRVRQLKQRQRMIGMMEGMWAQYGIPEYGKDWSFASYPEEGDQETLRECEAFAARKTICQGLYLFGPPGRGKSGLAVSILKVFLEKQEPGLYIRWPQYLRHYQRRRLSAEEEKQMDLIYTVPCLVMDDLGVEPPTEASIRQLYELLEERRGRAGLYTVITSNYSLEELEQYWRPQGYGPGEFHDGLRVIERLSESYAELEVLGPNLRKSI